MEEMTSFAFSNTSIFLPVVSVISVSGVSSTNSMSSAFRCTVLPFKRVTAIMGFLLNLSGRRSRLPSAVYLVFKIDDLLQNLVRGRDDPGVRLEAALRDDHFGKLGRQIDVRHFQLPGDDGARAGFGIVRRR